MIDSTQVVIGEYLKQTQILMDEMFVSIMNGGHSRIVSVLDLGFPHDVIRIAGGFATGSYVEWETSRFFVPVDTCVNDCAVSLFEIDRPDLDLFNEKNIEHFKKKMENSIYKLNFHRGNHFIALLRSKLKNKCYLLLHSSANEFKDNLNGLYPVNRNYFHERTKVFYGKNRYIRYLIDEDAAFFIRMALDLEEFNEIRQQFIASVFLEGCKARILSVQNYHHYGMPNDHSVVMGGYVATNGDCFPLLSSLGRPIYMVHYNKAIDSEVCINEKQFIVPHGLGKCDYGTPNMSVNIQDMLFSLDGINYKIEYGESLRDHPNLHIREMERDEILSLLAKQYDFSITDEYTQLASWNKQGVILWDSNCSLRGI